MTLPSVQKKWVIMGTKKGLDEFQFVEGSISKVGESQVLVRLHAASVNYRDVLIGKDAFPWSLRLPNVGGSDGSGEVVEVGSQVTKWKRGDRVATLFNPGHQFGPMTLSALNRGALGGNEEGTFQQYGVFDETGLVRLASHLSYIEGAVLPDSVVTAWNALYGFKELKPGQWVLLQGTGGVSLSALQFAKVGGAKVVATTSSAAKFDLLKDMGADHIINYKEDTDWGNTARKLTSNGEGFDHILEIGGYETFGHSLNAIKIEGVITLIGFLNNTTPPANNHIENILYKLCTVRALHVGSRVLMEEMMDAMEANNIHPIVDKNVFPLERLREALEYMEAAKHIGKVALRIE
ncbi:NAD(P)-binding protein [Thozetella sp. PMI_491]|nr:NAD(P)-binding protein [Thozetella sp. PMI_491]